jgi:hypothetical protein
MNAPLVEPAHSPFGGSVTTRVLHCPASVRLVEKLPTYLRKSSAYADRGTALHVAMALLLDDTEPSIESLRGKTINDYTVTDDDIELALRPVLTYVVALLDTPGAEFFLERRVIFPTIANTFGACDLNGDNVPGYTLSAGRAERHWCDEEHIAIAALRRLGLARDDVVTTTMRSPKQVELRAKARGLKLPQELIVSHRSGASLVKSENAHAPVPGRGEIVRSFSEALKAFQEGGTQ